MRLLQSVEIRNFRCFRKLTVVALNEVTYLVGPNNSGKTAFLSALHCFFDSNKYSSEYLNRTEFASRQSGFNQSEITLNLDLRQVSTVERRRRLQGLLGDTAAIKKIFTYREASGTITVEYQIAQETLPFERLNPDVQALLSKVAISYIHPQAGQDLLHRAQEKFKERLFSNWGRHASVSNRLKELQEQWSDLRATANNYLSAALTESLQDIWPGSRTTVELPERVQDMVAVSDITFSDSPTLPAISLASQGTGAQATILYQTHYLLDSDRSLHRGMYFPVWLLEEPEAFLHADISAKIGVLLSSSEWLEAIQILVSTHSPIVLAASRQNPEKASWVLFDKYSAKLQKPVSAVTEADIAAVGRAMGDSNFDAYFAAAIPGPVVAVEDTRPATRAAWEAAGVPVSLALHGTSEVRKYIEAFASLPGLLRKPSFFILDRDKGATEFGTYTDASHLVASDGSFDLFRICERVHILLLPPGSAVEDMFNEFEVTLDQCVRSVFDSELRLKPSVPADLARAVSKIRGLGGAVASWEQARATLKNEQDVKDAFWKRVATNHYAMAPQKVSPLRRLLDI